MGQLSKLRFKHLLLGLTLLHLSDQSLIDLGEGLVLLSKRAQLSGKVHGLELGLVVVMQKGMSSSNWVVALGGMAYFH